MAVISEVDLWNMGRSSGGAQSSQQSGGLQQSVSSNQSVGSQQSTSTQRGSSAQQASSIGESSSYIPEYSQTPILEGIAKYAQNMAPQVYEWGMGQFNKNQGNIDNMMKDAMSYASPQRVAQEMGQAQAGVMQGAEQGRLNATRDLESFGIDPSSGRYAALDSANRTMAGAMAAGAGNQQRMATEAAGGAMKNQAVSASLQNTQVGYGASDAMNKLLGTGMQLQYSPLGTRSYNASQSSGETTSATDSQSSGYNAASGGTQSSGSNWGSGTSTTEAPANKLPSGGGPVHSWGASMAEGGEVPEELSRSDGEVIDDVPANLTAGEFIIPKDVVEWKGQEFFYKLMAQARKLRATGGGGEPAHMGYGAN